MNAFQEMNDKIDSYNPTPAQTETGYIRIQRNIIANAVAKSFNSNLSGLNSRWVAVPRWIAVRDGGKGEGYAEAYNVDVYMTCLTEGGEFRYPKGNLHIALDKTYTIVEEGTPALKRDGLSETVVKRGNTLIMKSGKVIDLGETTVHDVVWNDKPNIVEEFKATPYIPWDSKDGKATINTDMAINLLVTYITSLPLDHTSPYMAGYKVVQENSWMPTIAEACWALTLTKKTGIVHLPTSIRASLPLPYGGIDGVVRDTKGFTQEDRIQMTGVDIMAMPEEMKADRKTVYKDGAVLDSKLISSVCNAKHNSDSAGVEFAMYDELHNTFDFNDQSMWSQSMKKSHDIGFVLRNRCFQISIASLQAKMKEKQEQFIAQGYNNNPDEYIFKQNLRPNGDGKYKWNCYLTTPELEELAHRSFEMDPLYARIMAQKAKDLVPHIKNMFNAEDLLCNLAYFDPEIKSLPVRR